VLFGKFSNRGSTSSTYLLTTNSIMLWLCLSNRRFDKSLWCSNELKTLIIIIEGYYLKLIFNVYLAKTHNRKLLGNSSPASTSLK
jgi:hypothetical protein